MATSFYIYYRLAGGAQALAKERVGALLQHVRQQTGVHGRLMTKRGESDLWMEVYDNVLDASCFQSILAAGIERLTFDALLMPGSSRHVESFEDELFKCV